MESNEQTSPPQDGSPWAAEPFAAGSAAPGRRRGPLLITLGVLLVLVAGALGYLFTRGADPALALRYTEGDSYRYQFRMSMDGSITSSEPGLDQPLVGEIDYVMALRVLQVDGDGVATMQVTLEDGTVTFNGQSQAVPGGFSATMRIAPDGRVLSSGGLGFASAGSSTLSMPGMDQFTPLLPDADAKPGDTWTKEFDIPMPFGEGALHYEVDGSFLRYEQVNGVRAAVIQSHVRAPLDFTVELRQMAELFGGTGADLPPDTDPVIEYSGLMEFDMTSWFDQSIGQPVRTVMSGNMDMRIRFTGFPETQGSTQGDVRLAGDVTMEVTTLDAG